MDFVISEGFIARFKRQAIIVVVMSILISIWIAYSTSEGEFDLETYAISLGVALVFFCWPQVNNLRKVLRKAQNHNLNVSSKGLSIVDYGVETIITWDLVTHIELKRKGKKFKTFLVVTKDSGKIELGDYNDLEKLSLEIKKHIGLDRVKER